MPPAGGGHAASAYRTCLSVCKSGKTVRFPRE